MTLLSVINGSTYLKKHNSLRKRSKRVKITKYVEQTLGKKNPHFFGLAAGFEGGTAPFCEFGWKLTPTHSCTPAVYFV